MPTKINPNVKNGLKLIEIPCPYSGKKLSSKEMNEMVRDTIPHLYEKNAVKTILTPEDRVKIQEYIKALDKMIERFPDNIDLRTYRAKIVEELKNFS